MFASRSFFLYLKRLLVHKVADQHPRKYIATRFATLLLLVVVPAHAAVTPRFICTLIDGRSHFSVTDLSAGFPESVLNCVPVPTETAAPELSLRTDLQINQVINATKAALALSRKSRVIAQPDAMSLELAAQIDAVSARHRLDPKLVGALIYVESRYRSDAVSPKGAIGLMQVMPATAKRYGVNVASQLFDPAVNLDVGTRYLRDLHAIYGQRVDLVLAAYNAGEGAVARYGQRVPPYPETLAYVAKIGSLLNSRDTRR
jgi:hypothetical protein